VNECQLNHQDLKPRFRVIYKHFPAMPNMPIGKFKVLVQHFERPFKDSTLIPIFKQAWKKLEL